MGWGESDSTPADLSDLMRIFGLNGGLQAHDHVILFGFSSVDVKGATMKATRREVLKTTSALGMLVSLGIVTSEQALAADSRPAFAANNLADALMVIGGKGAESDKVKVSAPDIAENGAVVPVGASSELPDTTQMWLLVEKNPSPMAAAFTIPEGTVADIDFRVRMGQTSDIYVVVKAGGQLHFAKKETKVTLGGCGG